MVIGNGYEDQSLTESQVSEILTQALSQVDLTGKRVLVIIPDSTRTAPNPLMFQMLSDLLGADTAALDFLVALGTHPVMDDAALSQLVGVPVVNGMAGGSH
ncbi:MAG: nickel-dependent lactate racemase, partial [Anaerolineae bacterium]|nr:nickel-dependent lactate racemase [Anaerolineae bacterium]